jgi:large subunit ribosomal protein L17
MVTSLFRYERIRTTKAKASAIRRTAEKMITRAKVDSVHNRRMVGRDIKDKAILAKLFTDIGPRFEARPGGYTRMLKIGQRRGDASEMVLLELVEEELNPKPKQKTEPKGRATGTKKSKTKDQTSSKAAKSESEPTAKEKATTDKSPSDKDTSAQESAPTEDAAVKSESSEEQAVAEDKEEGSEK